MQKPRLLPERVIEAISEYVFRLSGISELDIDRGNAVSGDGYNPGRQGPLIAGKGAFSQDAVSRAIALILADADKVFQQKSGRRGCQPVLYFLVSFPAAFSNPSVIGKQARAQVMIGMANRPVALPHQSITAVSPDFDTQYRFLIGEHQERRSGLRKNFLILEDILDRGAFGYNTSHQALFPSGLFPLFFGNAAGTGTDGDKAFPVDSGLETRQIIAVGIQTKVFIPVGRSGNLDDLALVGLPVPVFGNQRFSAPVDVSDTPPERAGNRWSGKTETQNGGYQKRFQASRKKGIVCA
jgi:hypothetical protein